MQVGGVGVGGWVAQALDHVVAVTAGGTDDDSNLVAACKPCNERRRREQALAGRPQRKREPEPHPGARVGPVKSLERPDLGGARDQSDNLRADSRCFENA